jgi:hypothetical protein
VSASPRAEVEKPLPTRASQAADGRASIKGAAEVPATRHDRAADVRAVQRVVNKYRDGFSVLDTSWVKSVWPGVDAEALGETFARIREQNVEFARCQISVMDVRADASCRGTVQYTLHGVGNRPRIEFRQWRFGLRKSAGAWMLESVDSRQGVREP